MITEVKNWRARFGLPSASILLASIWLKKLLEKSQPENAGKQRTTLLKQYHLDYKNLLSSQLRLLPLLANSAQSLNGSLQVWCFIFRLFEQLAMTNEDSDLTPLLQSQTAVHLSIESENAERFSFAFQQSLATFWLPLLRNKLFIKTHPVKSLPKKLPKGAIQRPTQRHPQSWKIRM